MSAEKAMVVSYAKIDCSRIADWPSFHDEFHRVFGFPDFYGRNMDAWIDCMTSRDCPDERMTSIHCEAGKLLTIELSEAPQFKKRCPDQYEALVDCAGFVNWRRIEKGDSAVLALSYRV